MAEFEVIWGLFEAYCSKLTSRSQVSEFEVLREAEGLGIRLSLGEAARFLHSVALHVAAHPAPSKLRIV